MYYDFGVTLDAYLRIARDLARAASKRPFGSRAHQAFMAASIEYTRDRASLRMVKADR